MNEFLEFLARHERPVIVSHVDPDGDAVGSALGLAWMLRARGADPQVLVPGGVPDTYQFLPGSEDVGSTAGQVKDDRDSVISLDATSPKRLRGVEEVLDLGLPVANVDHHPDNSRFGDVQWIDPTACATALMVYELAEPLGVSIDDRAAAALYTGIVTDTGRFTFSNSDARAMAAGAELAARGADISDIATRVYQTRSPQMVRLLARALSELELRDDGTIACLSVTRAMLEETGATAQDSDGFSTWARSIAGVQVGVFFRELEDGETKISFRSNGGVTIHGVAGQFGGGGHPSAAGARVSLPLEEAKERVLTAISEHLRSLV